jgi:hypothetical protein
MLDPRNPLIHEHRLVQRVINQCLVGVDADLLPVICR